VLSRHGRFGVDRFRRRLRTNPHQILVAAEERAVRIGDAVSQRDAWPPADSHELGARHQLPRRTVGLRGIADDLAGEADHLGNQLREVVDRQILARADIDVLVFGVVLITCTDTRAFAVASCGVAVKCAEGKCA